MIPLLLAYLTFQILFDHWADNSVAWKVIYFAFQYLWVAAVAIQQAFRNKYRAVLVLIAIIFTCIGLNELTYLHAEDEAYLMMISAPPAYALTLMATGAYIIYEILARWKKR